MNLQQYSGTNAKSNNAANIFTGVLLFIYLIGIFWIIVLKFNIHIANMGKIRIVNLIPFKRPLNANDKIGFGEMIMNVLIFVPLGVYTGTLYKKWAFVKHIVLFFTVSVICEASQYILKVGFSDITDVINNTAGGIIGLLVCRRIEKIFNNSTRAQKFINIVSAAATIVTMSFLLFLKTHNLWLFRMNTLHK